jgi:hypothetical protein
MRKFRKMGWAKQGWGLSNIRLVKKSSPKYRYKEGMVRGLTWAEQGRNGKGQAGPGFPNPY